MHPWLADLLSAWGLVQRTKRSSVLACKFWQEISTPLLYREIHLRHIGIVAVLLGTLQCNTRLGEMIMDINVSCHVMSRYFQRILRMSSNSTQLSLKWVSATYRYSLYASMTPRK
ncbi:uncharacterized protein F5147DRAFT_7843 [Suillus discolor]|uniref:Uncharacterized protein n=1 Tax=Suillus discolor TaxID=1912936 RepID=A0A9P7K213_9AGAM|nr:uncharacterized protein F5147DRAFT_7843 [Suillus discolor]KAG2120742.1 hypothetical protein F5147DRAFT_7843 [Suillus discolor]